jgi:hypothetical protein
MPSPYTYQYRPQDDPLTVANQFNVTPQQLLAANPGGTPFSVGQTIKIPQGTYQYSAPIGPQAPGAPQAVSQYNQPIGPQAPNMSQQWQNANQTMNPRGGVGMQPYGPAISPTPTWQDRAALGVENGYAPQSYLNIIKRLSRGEDVNLSPEQRRFLENAMNTPAAQAAQAEAAGQTPGTFDPTKPYGGFTNDDPTNTDYANTKAAQYYAAAGTPFLQQQRWDPQARRYVSLGKLLKQGKLDLQGNWHRRRRGGGGGGGGGGRQAQQAQQAQDYTLANSLINFSASSG